MQAPYVGALAATHTLSYISPMSIQATLKELMARRGWTQDDVARELAVTQATVSRWFKGSDPRGETRDRIRALADEAPSSTAMRSVPVMSWISAGAMAETASVENWSDLNTIEVADLPDGDWIALEVTGDSMDRISPPGSMVLVNRKDKRLVPNACYVVADDEGSATYKRWRPSPSRFEPVSTNPTHEPLFPRSEPLIVGRVKRSFIDM